MQKAVIYPGSFDPITNGHLDLIVRASTMFNKLVIAVSQNRKKEELFQIEKRIELIHESIQSLNLNSEVIIEAFDGLMVDFCKQKNIFTVIRGLRAVSDFEYEYAMFLMNKQLLPHLETTFFMSTHENSFISSSLVKEVACYNGDTSSYVPACVKSALDKKCSLKEPV